jgi:hypothetical protein
VNYIQLINAFWEKHETDQNLKATSITVYMALVQINNRTGWKDKFRVTFGQVLNMTNISKNTYYSAIAELVEGKYIEYEKGPNQYQAATFKTIMLYQNLVQHEYSNGIAQVQQQDSIENIPKQENTKIIKLKKRVFTPPPLDEVKNYFLENGFSEQKAVNAYNYYNVANWHDGKGYPVLNWKQKMRGVWFKDDSREKSIAAPAPGKAASLINQFERVKFKDNE